MVPANRQAFIRTEDERCRICYTCVRECPAKAIRIVDGQAEIVPERCIVCGNCVKVCSLGAKQSIDSTPAIEEILAGPGPTAAIVAPSFPAEFADFDPEELVGMLRRLGFDLVCEVAFGADLVAERYRRLVARNDNRRYIASSCPAVIAYVERYHPQLSASLAPIVSPMVAMGRVLKQERGSGLRVVFIGPCLAKKAEALSHVGQDAIDGVLSFRELRLLFAHHGITPAAVHPSPFDPPHGGTGALLAISRGMLQAAGIAEDLLDGEVVATEGRHNMVEAVKEFGDGNLQAKLLELLCCDGCVMGPGMLTTAPLFSRRSSVSRYARQHQRHLDQATWQEAVDRYATLDLSRSFTPDDQRLPGPADDQIQVILSRMGKQEVHDELNCGACGYETCREHAEAIYKGLAESEMCLPYMVDKLSETVQELERSHADLATTQEQLMQSEKLASMGQLAAGIAHEVNNPLGVVLMYAHLLLDDSNASEELRDDLRMIATQADRCKKIVSGLLDFARQNKVLRQPSNILAAVETALKSVIRPPGITLERDYEIEDPIADIDVDQILQALTNLIANAYAAMGEEGVLRVSVSERNDQVCIAIADTGTGIPPEIQGRIFDPFFTTKQIGIGTGLGLAVVYGIIKMHRGDITVRSATDAGAGPTGTTFTITLPRKDITDHD